MIPTTHESILSLTDRVALVTGAGQGVGREVALTFARNGARAVIVNDFDEARAALVAQEVESAGARAVVMATDITDYDAVTSELGAAFG